MAYSTTNRTGSCFQKLTAVSWSENCGPGINEVSSAYFIEVYPNPASAFLNITLNNEESIDVKIVDVLSNSWEVYS